MVLVVIDGAALSWQLAGEHALYCTAAVCNYTENSKLSAVTWWGGGRAGVLGLPPHTYVVTTQWHKHAVGAIHVWCCLVRLARASVLHGHHLLWGGSMPDGL